MPIDHIDIWDKYGLPGLVIAALFVLVWYLTKEHRAERSEWILAYRAQSEQAIEAQRESSEVIRNLAVVIERSASRRRVDDFDLEQHR